MLEKHEQCIFVDYCKRIDRPAVMINNGFLIGGGIDKYKYINSLKSQGLKTGFPDIMVLTCNSRHPVVFFEFKREKTGKISERQQEWHNWLKANDYPVFVVTSADKAVEILHGFLR